MGVLQGQTLGNLSNLGHHQAMLAGWKLRDVPFDKVITSPLYRTKQTTREIMQFRESKEVEILDLVQERGYGVIDTLPKKVYDEAIEKHGDMMTFKPEGGESLQDLYD